MIDRLSPLARNIALGVLFVLLAWFAWTVRSVLNPLILGYLLAFILHPLVLRLEKRGWTRRKAVNLIFTGFAIGLTLLGVAIFFQARSLTREFASDEGLGAKIEARLDEGLHKYEKEIQWVMSLVRRPEDAREPAVKPVNPDGPANPDGNPAQPGELTSESLFAFFKDAWMHTLDPDQRQAIGEAGLGTARWVLALFSSFFGGVLQFLGLLILWPLYTYFLLFELERIHSFVARYLPYQERARFVRIATQIGEVLASFFRGRLLVCLIKGVVLAVGFAIAGVDYALLLGLGSGFLSLIPFVGSTIGYTFAFLIALLDFGLAGAVVRTGIVIVIAESLENYVLIPKILGDSLGLHPIVVIFAIMAGGASMGMFGLLVALPITASLVILAREFLLPVLAQMADRQPRTGSR